MLQDYKLGLRMLVKYPGLTLAGGLALAVAIGIGAAWSNLLGDLLAPAIPLPHGDRVVLIEMQNARTNEPEPRILHDFLEWRRELRTIADLGAYRTETRNLIADGAVPEPIQIAELTAAAFRTARVSPRFGRGLVDADETPGAPGVVVLAYEVWQRLGGRQDIIGSIVNLGIAPVTVIGVMPAGFAYPINHDAWIPLRLRGSYAPLEGGPISVIGRLAPGMTRAQANTELRALGERAAAMLPATHEHLRPQVLGLGEVPEIAAAALLAMTNLPVLLVLAVACMTVGTLVYARTATREGEIAVRSALGASRRRIVGQLFIEAFVLASVSAVVGLVAADRLLRWGIDGAFADEGGVPFWMTRGLKLATVVYATALAIISAAMLSLLPALRVTRARVHSHLANLGSGGATLRFGRVWTTAMIVQVALTAMAIPGAMETVSQTTRNRSIRAEFPSREYLAGRLDFDRLADEEAAAFEDRRTRAVAELERRLAEEPGVVGVTFADFVPGSGPGRSRIARIEPASGAGPSFEYQFRTAAVTPGFFEVFDRAIVAGRSFHSGDRNPAARTVIVNEAFARGFGDRGGNGLPLATRLQYAEAADPGVTEPWFEIVGIVRDFRLDPNDRGDEAPYVFHAAAAGAIAPLALHVRMRGNPAALAPRLPIVASSVDAGLTVLEARPLSEWVSRRDMQHVTETVAVVGVTSLILFLSALGIFSLLSVSVSRQTREIGLRAALGANPRQVLARVVSRAAVLMGSGVAVGGAALMFLIVIWEEDVALFAGWFAATSIVMVIAGLLASLGPARRALRINPIDALRQV